MADALLAGLFSSPAMEAIFGPTGRLQGLLDLEAALARVEARLGLIPAAAAETIAAACRAELIDPAALAREVPPAGNTAIPLLRQLTQLVAERDPDAARYVHWGATSQDAMDTGLMLQARAGLDVLAAALRVAGDGAASLAERHCDTLMPGRTWLQHALPITFGLKAAGWLDALTHHRDRLTALRRAGLALQFGGAAGTLASLGDPGLAVAEALAAELALPLPTLPWHTQRARIVELGGALAALLGSLGKIARDVSLLMQTELGEVAEPSAPGRGGSSAMPHKRNPVASAAVLGAAARAPGLAATLLAGMAQEHERGLGGWHAEWTALPELFELAGGALAHTGEMLTGLTVDAARMGANLDVTRGLILAEAVKMGLAPHLGQPQAHVLVEQACRAAAEQGLHLGAVLAAEPRVAAVLSPAELEQLLDPARYLGQSAALVARALAAYRRREP